MEDNTVQLHGLLSVNDRRRGCSGLWILSVIDRKREVLTAEDTLDERSDM
jgi:hypothetical protein